MEAINWTLVVGLLWIGGFVGLRVLAAYEVGGRTRSGALEASVGLAWAQGRSKRARLYARLAWIWLGTFAALLFLLSLR